MADSFQTRKIKNYLLGAGYTQKDELLVNYGFVETLHILFKKRRIR